MKILVTGSQGFIGKNLVYSLIQHGYEVLEYDRTQTLEELNDYTQHCDFVVHLAGINRPMNPEEFYAGNSQFTGVLCDLLIKNKNKVPILVSSSIHASGESDYGKSKKEGEQILLNYQDAQTPVYILRLSNVYGKWSRPNYNTVIATWCYNVANDLDIVVNDEDAVIPFVYIDDVVSYIIKAINGEVEAKQKPYYEVYPIDAVSLGEVKTLLESFKASRCNYFVPNLETNFSKNLYSTYLSFIPGNQMKYPLKTHSDHRGSFTEFLKTEKQGQVSINVSKPGITKGQHWHHSKNEKFLVVSGKGMIRMRNLMNNEIYEYEVTGEKLEVVDIPTGYTHNIINTGTEDLVTIMWANELFDSENPDTYYEEV